jgi:hypothetical protein
VSYAGISELLILAENPWDVLTEEPLMLQNEVAPLISFFRPSNK